MKLRKKLIVLFICFSFLCGCTKVKRTRIAYTVYPIGYIISRLSGTSIPYQSIENSSYDAVMNTKISKDYQSVLNRSQVLFHLGNLEPYYSVYEKNIEETGVKVVDLSKGNAVYDFGRYQKVNDEEDTYETVPYYSDSCFEVTDALTKDLYLWLDPIAMLSMSKEIRDWLIGQYPINRTMYESNYTLLENDLIALDAQYQILRDSNEVSVVTMTDSFGCWQKEYGIKVYPVILSRYGVLPDEEQIQVIENRIRKDQVKYIAYESNMNEEMTQLFTRIQEECGLTRIELSNISNLSENEELEGKDYLSLMYQNLSVLKSIADTNTQGGNE